MTAEDMEKMIEGRIENGLKDLSRELDYQAERLTLVTKLLEKMEWSSIRQGFRHCPCCGAPYLRGSHDPGCMMRLFLEST